MNTRHTCIHCTQRLNRKRALGRVNFSEQTTFENRVSIHACLLHFTSPRLWMLLRQWHTHQEPTPLRREPCQGPATCLCVPLTCLPCHSPHVNRLLVLSSLKLALPLASVTSTLPWVFSFFSAQASQFQSGESQALLSHLLTLCPDSSHQLQPRQVPCLCC